MKKTALLAMAFVFAFGMNAERVTSVAGDLKNVVSDKSATELAVSGTMDARDFKFIADSLANLTSIDLGEVTIEEYVNEAAPVFYSITSYAAGTIPATAFFGSKIESVVLPATLQGVGEAAFAGCANLKSIAFPATLTAIEPYAFTACDGITALKLPSSLATLGTGAFARCAKLESVTFAPAAAMALGNDAFMDCPALATVTLGANVTAIGPQAFAGCTALKSMSFANGNKLTAIAQGAFMRSAVETMELGNCRNLTTIGMWAFANTPLRAIAFPSSVESVGDGALYYDTELKSYSLPRNLNSISNFLLSGNTGVAMGAPVRDGISSIGDYAFYNWDQLTSFTFPESVQYVGTMAMAGQTGLEVVKALPMEVPELGDDVWAGVPQHQIPLDVDKDVANDYKAAAQWQEFIIESLPTGIDETLAGTATDVKARFAGSALVVTATAEIAQVSLFDVNGVLLSATAAHDTQVEIDTANCHGRFYVVNVILADGTRRAFKLMRQ